MEILWIVSLFSTLGGYYIGHRIGYRSGAYDCLLLSDHKSQLAARPEDLLDAKLRVEEDKEINEILCKISKT